MVSIVVQGVESPIECLILTDAEYKKCTLVTLGEKSCLIKKMREISEVLFVAGDEVLQDMSQSLTGFPTINHKGVHLQVIPWKDYLEGSSDTKSLDFEATGAHLHV